MKDLISRQAALEHLKNRLYETELNSNARLPYYAEMADNRVSVWLNEVPTIDPAENGGCWGCCCEKLGQVRQGFWLKYHGNSVSADGLWGETLYDCSVCGHTIHVATKYCAECGAKWYRTGWFKLGGKRKKSENNITILQKTACNIVRYMR